ncbi:hypothetical protein F5Y08DRAFT_312744 [Xylaria arbuscula]|nr:hypothetical protein F5Y08DRAFT_312744 [Xylaria arbuscula]
MSWLLVQTVAPFRPVVILASTRPDAYLPPFPLSQYRQQTATQAPAWYVLFDAEADCLCTTQLHLSPGLSQS